MNHPLEAQYGLTAYELLDAVNKRFRLKAALEGAVAEVQMERRSTRWSAQSLSGTNPMTWMATPTSAFGFRGGKSPCGPSARMSATMTKPTVARGRLSPTWPRRKRPALRTETNKSILWCGPV